MRRPLAVVVALLAALPLAPGALALDPGKSVSQYTLTVWRTENGLPQDSLTAIAQDASGALWLGTPSGLVRFDGSRFRRVSGGEISPADRYVTGLAATADGRLWVSTRDALFERDLGGVVRRHGAEAGIPPGGAYGLAAAPDGAVWIACGRGLLRFAGGRAELVPVPAGESGESVALESYGLALGAGGRVVAATSRGALIRDERGVRLFGRAHGLPTEGASTVLEDRSGRIWAGTPLGLFRLEGERFEPVAVDPSGADFWVRALAEDRDGTLWIGARDGGAFRLVGERLEAASGEIDLPNLLVRQIFEDRDGSLWWVTAGGLARLTDGAVTTWTDRQGLPSRFVWSLAESAAGGLWVGTNGVGVAHLDERGAHPPPFDGAALAGSEIRALLTDRAGTLWIGTAGRGLARVRGRRLEFPEGGGRDASAIWSLFEDRAGRLWAGGSEGLLELERGRVAKVHRRSGLPPSPVRALADDGAGALWVGFAAGLARFDGTRLGEVAGAEALATTRIHCILPSAEGIWLATDGGLARLAGGRLERWTVREGLPIDMLYWLIDDGAGSLWASSDVGIVRLPKSELQEIAERRRARLEPLVLGRGDGMRATECNSGQPAGVRRRDGALCFATVDGVACADPRRLATLSAPPPVAVHELWIDGTAHDPGSASPVRLASGAHRVEFRYAATALLAPEKIGYRYRLEGFDEGWVEAGAADTAQFTGLPPGTYRFLVAARRAGGDWGAAAASTALVVRPAFHQTALFYVFFTATIGLVAVAGYRLRTRQLRLRAGRLAALVEERTSELERANAELERVSLADGLTRIANRRHFDHRLDQEWRRAARNGTPLSLILADIDHFKAFNDVYGHLAGDECLRAVAATLSEAVLRADDLVARYGGEEIAVLLPGTAPADAAQLAERLRQLIESLDRRHERSPEGRVTMSLGVAGAVPEPHSRPESLILAADRALYRAKAAGRNRVEA